MKKEEFEKTLMHLPVPDVGELRHEALLAKATVRAEERTILSLWWLIIPGYILAAFVMKGFFMPHSRFWPELRGLAHREKLLGFLLFLILPVLALLLNIVSIRRLYFLSGNPGTTAFLRSILVQVVMITLSTAIFVIYLIEII